MKNRSLHFSLLVSGALVVTLLLVLGTGCSSTKAQNKAKEAAAKYWQDKAYPGKAYDVQVLEAEDAGDGTYRVKGIVDGETRVGSFSPSSEIFSEGYYTMAHEKTKRVAELEQEVKYWKEKAENLEKEVYKLQVQAKMSGAASSGDTTKKQ